MGREQQHCMVYVWCVGFAFLYVVCDELYDCIWNVVYVFVSKALLISNAAVIVRRGAIWLNPFVMVLFSVCSAVTVECCVLYPCCMGVFGMFALMLLNVMEMFSVGGVALLNRPYMVFHRVCMLCL